MQDGVGPFIVAELRKPHPRGAKIGNIPQKDEWCVEAGFLNAADHDGFVAPGGPEAADPGAQASDADPMELVAFLLQLGPGVAAHADANDLASGCFGSASHEYREYAFASYETQRSHQKMILGPS
jgi:hypothetical protein